MKKSLLALALLLSISANAIDRFEKNTYYENSDTSFATETFTCKDLRCVQRWEYFGTPAELKARLSEYDWKQAEIDACVSSGKCSHSIVHKFRSIKERQNWLDAALDVMVGI